MTISNSISMDEVISELKLILDKKNVLTEYEERFCYAYDATAIGEELYLPDVVVLPETTGQVAKVMKMANKYKIPVITRGAGTNLCGGCIPLKNGIVIHTSKLNKIISIDKDNLTCIVEAGAVVEKLQQEVEKLGLFYPPDPSNLKVSTIGGSVALSSSGPRCFKYGGTKDYVLGLEVVTAKGKIINVGGNTVKNVTGYNLSQLFVGSEGTLGIVTRVTLKLIPLPESKQVMLVFFDSIDDAATAVTDIISHKITPSTLDLMDQKTMDTVEQFHPTGLPTHYDAALVIEIDGVADAISVQAKQIEEISYKNNAKDVRIAKDKKEADEIWFARRSAFGAVARMKPNVITEDAVVPRAKIPQMVKAIRKIADKYNLTVCTMGHAGDGNLHPNFSLDLRDHDEHERLEKAVEELFDAAIELGGTLSGEHGIGMSKARFMNKVASEEVLEYMRLIKNSFDPNGILNPGKILIK